MPSATKNRFLLLYGSQTGQAKAISEEIAEKAEKLHLIADIHCLSQTEKKFNIEREHCIVIVTSTTGDGDPPDTASKFVRRLKKKTLPPNHLENLNYALLGLGDSNYTNFCNNGKTVDRRLEDLGAKRFYESGWADDAVGLEVAVEPWMEGLFPALQKFLSVSDTTTSDSNTDCIKRLADSSSSGENGVQQNGKHTGESFQADRKNNGNSVIKNKENSNDITDSVSSSDTNLTSNSLDNKNNPKVGNVPQTNIIAESKSVQNNLQSEKCNNESNCLPSLTVSVPPLSESSVSIPVLPAAFLKLEYNSENSVNLSEIPLQNGSPLPSAASPVTMTTVMSATVLTRHDALKKTLCMKLDTKNGLSDYMPGDSISIVVQNTDDEVEALLKRLDVSNTADTTCSLSVIEGTKKRNAAVPSHIPPLCTLRHIFTTCLDIREPPKKALLRSFVEYTSDPGQMRRLQELCSKQGAADFTQFIRQPSCSIMDVLTAFPSCQPSVERLLEHLSRLQPRPYSICSSPLVDRGIIELVFNIVNVPSGDGRSYSRHGVCTGMLDKVTQAIQSNTSDDVIENISTNLHQLEISNKIEIPIFNRTNQHFRMPDDLTIPIIMVGPGTGVAPFVGFLRHRQALRKDMSDPTSYGETWLFFGCRHQDRDYIYRNELEQFHANGVLTKLCVCFSRDEQEENSPRYVQDNIRNFSPKLSTLILEQNAMVFVCGDANNMARDVNEALISAIQSQKGCTVDEARAEIMKMRLHKRYLEDVWT